MVSFIDAFGILFEHFFIDRNVFKVRLKREVGWIQIWVNRLVFEGIKVVLLGFFLIASEF
jgi:hypothetical protein